MSIIPKDLFIDKYKPIYFNDYENSKTEIIQLLKTMIQINNLNIIFIGIQGCGKTTLINTLIKEYYKYKHTTDDLVGKPTSTITSTITTTTSTPNYTDGGNDFEKQNSNVLRINSLKEQGITYFRNDVKIFCQTSSTIKNKKKILVLDDIDNINEQIQQIFRNCIDKYSNNVHFICSCNNTQKVIENLQSRLTIIQIQPLYTCNITHFINKIITDENIIIDTEVIDFILSISNNVVNVIINYLEKFKILNEKITMEIALNICTNINYVILKEYTELVKLGLLNEAISLIYSIYDKGYSNIDILNTYFLFIKFTDILTENEKYDVIPIICKYISIFYNMNEDQIENALFTNELVQIFTRNI